MIVLNDMMAKHVMLLFIWLCSLLKCTKHNSSAMLNFVHHQSAPHVNENEIAQWSYSVAKLPFVLSPLFFFASSKVTSFFCYDNTWIDFFFLKKNVKYNLHPLCRELSPPPSSQITPIHTFFQFLANTDKPKILL